MKKLYKIFGITLFSFIMLLLLNSCPGLFKDVEAIIIKNKSSYTIDFFIDDEYENTIAPGINYETANYTNVTHTLLCTSGSLQWGPISIKLKKGEPYTWTINNHPKPTETPTPEPTKTPMPTPKPTLIPQGDITINNNSSSLVTIYISGNIEGTINAGSKVTYTKEIGNYNLLAIPQSIIGSWQENIDLTEEGYTWNLNTNTELYPSKNCHVWNFENTYNNHKGIDVWDEKKDVICSTEHKKYGEYSFFATENNTGYFYKENFWTVGQSQAMGCWLYISMINPNFYPSIISLVDLNSISDNYSCLFLYYENNQIIFSIIKNGTLSKFVESNILDNNWHYIAMTYDSENDILYGIIDDNIFTYQNLPGSWIIGQGSFRIAVHNLPNRNIQNFIDEIIYFPNQFIDPQVFVDHYNNNIPLGAEYIP